MGRAVEIGQLRRMIENYVEEHHVNTGVRDWWQTPLVVSAAADERFDDLTQVAAGDHLLPRELLGTARSVVVFFLPFARELVEANAEGDFAIPDWAQAYADTNRLIGQICDRVSRFLDEAGYQSAVTTATKNFDRETLTAKWSHKHLAYLCGLGKFGVNTQMITPSGCCGRLGSLVTEAILGDHPVTPDGEACLHRNGGECLACALRCPVTALSPDGIDRKRCWARLLINEKRLKTPPESHVCGKCVAMMPCSFVNPVSTD